VFIFSISISYFVIFKSCYMICIRMCLSILVIMVCFVVLCQKYYHGESIAINVLVDNNTNKSVKKIKISGEFKHVVLKYCL